MSITTTIRETKGRLRLAESRVESTDNETTTDSGATVPSPSELPGDSAGGDGGKGAPDSEAGNEAEPEEAESLSLDVVFEIAKNERRRIVLQFLRGEEEPVSLSDLAEYVAARENDKEIGALTSGERKRVYVGLYQCHLPKMDDAGVIDFERNPGITLGRNADQIYNYLETESGTDGWYRYYLGLVGFGGVTFLAGQALSSVSALLPDLAAGAFLLGTAVCALAHARAVRDDGDD